MARLHREMMDALTQEIVGGRLAPGSMLPREVDLADRFGVSRGVAREGIRAMEERGLISVHHGKGAIVNPPASWNTLDPDVLRPLLASPFSVGVLESYLECRRILEVEAAGLSAERRTEADVSRMRDALAAMEEVVARDSSPTIEARFHEADVAFHQAIIAGTRNSALGTITEAIQVAVVTARFWLADDDYRALAMPEHRQILTAIADRDRVGARVAMAAHLDTIERYVTSRAKARSL